MDILIIYHEQKQVCTFLFRISCAVAVRLQSPPQDMGKNMKEQIRQEIMESAQCRDLYTELTEYERRGIRIKMNGDPASPLQIASAYAVREEPSYMRDYIADDEGMVKEVCFVELEDDDVRR